MGPSRDGFRRFLGVGLGGGRGKSTAVARLELGEDGRLGVAEARLRRGHKGTGRVDEPEGDLPKHAVFHDDVLVDYLTRWTGDDTVVAIDAPLTLPPCVRCDLACPGIESCTVPAVAWMRRHALRLRPERVRRDTVKPPVTPYTQRATELLLAHLGLHPRETLGQGMGPLAARAAYLRRALSPGLRLHENLIEVHPRATLVRLFGNARERRARHGDTERVRETRKQMLASLTDDIEFDYVWPELVVRSGRLFDAVICAFSAYLWARQGWRGPSDLVAAAPQTRETEANALQEAVDDLGLRWVEEGWIWTPP
jgi:predicted nuclease with RNAse H fold